MRMSRLILLTLILFMGFLVLGKLMSAIAAKPGVNQTGYNMIQEGMPLQDVESILGGPGELVELKRGRRIWSSERTSIHIFFDREGKVTSKLIHERESSIGDSIRCFIRKVVGF